MKGLILITGMIENEDDIDNLLSEVYTFYNHLLEQRESQTDDVESSEDMPYIFEPPEYLQ